MLFAKLTAEVRARDEAADTNNAKILTKRAIVLCDSASLKGWHQQPTAKGLGRIFAYLPKRVSMERLEAKISERTRIQHVLKVIEKK
jgi:hypothetical protein